MSKHATRNAVILGIVIAVVVFGVMSNWKSLSNQANLSGGDQPSTTYSSNNQPSNQATTQQYTGPLTMNDAITDALNPATTRTDGTNAAVTYYEKMADGTYQSRATSSSNTASVYVTGGVTKTIWMSVVIPSGQPYYVALDKMQGSYPRLGTATWGDLNLDNLYEPDFPIDVTNLNDIGKSNTNPQLTIPIQLYTQSATGSITSNSGNYITNTNHTGVGAGTVQNTEPLTLNFATPATGIALMQFKAQLNDTVLTDMNTGQSYCDVPFGSTTKSIHFNDPSVQPIYGASTTTYTFNIASDQTIRTADLITVPKVGATWVPFNCYIYSTLPATNNGFTVTPSWIWVDMQGATHTVTGHIFKIVA